MRFLVFIAVLVCANVASAQTWVHRHSTTVATYDPVTATTYYRQCFCGCYVTGKCTCHPYCVRTWKTYNVPEKARRGIVTTLDLFNRVLSAPFREPIRATRPPFFRTISPGPSYRLPETKLQ